MLEDLGRKTEDQIKSHTLTLGAAALLAMYVAGAVMTAFGAPAVAVGGFVTAAAAAAGREIYRTANAAPAFWR
jgi:hypothetical protein